MPFAIAAVLVAIVHLATAATAWTGVGLLADDHEMIGAAILRHRGDWTLASAFLPAPADGATRALYRPFIDVLFWLEQPWFGIEPFGYHVVNSVMHCGTALVWFVLVRRWSGSIAAGLATALLFVGWPGHSEVTHWIAARTNVQSVFLLSLALLWFDLSLARAALGARTLFRLAAAVFAVLAVGSKESAVFVVPLALVLAVARGEAGRLQQRLTAAGVAAAPIAATVFAWLAWRARLLGTWGSGTHYGWRPERVGARACSDWLEVLFAPVHRDHLPGLAAVGLAAVHVAIALVASAALRRAGGRPVWAVGATLLVLGYVAGIGLETLYPDVLQNVRYSYEPALGLCLVLGVGVASLPARARGPSLAALVLVHAIVLDHNRRSWLDAAAVYRTMQREVLARATETRAPVRVFDAPGVYDGAFAYLNGYTEFLFWQQTAPPGTDLRGGVASTVEWRAVLAELAAAAAAKQRVDASVVRWDDGGLAPFAFDGQWPAEVAPGTAIGYARVARARPFVGSQVPVDVLVRTDAAVELVASCGAGDARATVAPGDRPEAVRLVVPVGADSAPATLLVRCAGAERRFDLGEVAPVPRR